MTFFCLGIRVYFKEYPATSNHHDLSAPCGAQGSHPSRLLTNPQCRSSSPWVRRRMMLKIHAKRSSGSKFVWERQYGGSEKKSQDGIRLLLCGKIKDYVAEICRPNIYLAFGHNMWPGIFMRMRKRVFPAVM